MRSVVLAVFLSLTAGVGIGFIWWGLPLQRLRDDVDAAAVRAAAAFSSAVEPAPAGSR
ncbi:MAG: hypothetical protein FJ027_08230 [Candidatus Rokubacteria bacterium]|nr:hypothetical protein [Candidatus Rokubacteria bacterium]